MGRHAGEVGQDGVEERRAVLGHIGGHALQEEQDCFHWLGGRGGGEWAKVGEGGRGRREEGRRVERRDKRRMGKEGGKRGRRRMRGNGEAGEGEKWR